jgi:hypothetical protein
MNAAKSTTGRQIRSVIVVIFYVGCAGIVALPILICSGIAMLDSSNLDRHRDVVDVPAVTSRNSPASYGQQRLRSFPSMTTTVESRVKANSILSLIPIAQRLKSG